MKLSDYKFNIGDEVITTDGIKGKIVGICTCGECEKRGFYEPIWRSEDAGYDKYITCWTAESGFAGFYSIGDYRFNEFDKGDVLREMADYEDTLKQLRKQLKVIEEIEANERC